MPANLPRALAAALALALHARPLPAQSDDPDVAHPFPATSTAQVPSSDPAPPTAVDARVLQALGIDPDDVIDPGATVPGRTPPHGAPVTLAAEPPPPRPGNPPPPDGKSDTTASCFWDQTPLDRALSDLRARDGIDVRIVASSPIPLRVSGDYTDLPGEAVLYDLARRYRLSVRREGITWLVGTHPPASASTERTVPTLATHDFHVPRSLARRLVASHRSLRSTGSKLEILGKDGADPLHIRVTDSPQVLQSLADAMEDARPPKDAAAMESRRRRLLEARARLLRADNP